MTSERINDEIARLMDEAFDALRSAQWATVRDRTRAVIAFDPDHQEASRLLVAATRMLDAGDVTAPIGPVPPPSTTAETALVDRPAIPPGEPAVQVAAAAATGHRVRVLGAVSLGLSGYV